MSVKKPMRNALKKKANRQNVRVQFGVTPGEAKAFKEKHGSLNQGAKAHFLGSIDDL